MFRAFFWQRILAGKQPFRIRIAYYPSFFFDHSSKYHENLEGKRNIIRKTPTFLFSPNGRKSDKYLKSSKLEGLRISAAEVFDTFFPIFQAPLNGTGQHFGDDF